MFLLRSFLPSSLYNSTSQSLYSQPPNPHLLLTLITLILLFVTRDIIIWQYVSKRKTITNEHQYVYTSRKVWSIFFLFAQLNLSQYQNAIKISSHSIIQGVSQSVRKVLFENSIYFLCLNLFLCFSEIRSVRVYLWCTYVDCLCLVLFCLASLSALLFVLWYIYVCHMSTVYCYLEWYVVYIHMISVNYNSF